MAAARAALGGVAKGGGTSASQEAVEEQRDAWVPTRVKTWPGWLSTAPAAVLHSGGAENRADELEEGEKDPNAISEISRDQNVKQR